MTGINAAVCVGVKGDPQIGRIREWCLHYINLGFTRIYLFDNNDIDGPNPLDVLADLTDYIQYIDIRGNYNPNRQWVSYSLCYLSNSNKHTHILFVDDDEYLILYQDKSINEYLSRPQFQNIDCIHINWKVYNSGDILFEDPNIPLIQQYTTPIPYNLCNYPNIPEDDHVKTLVRCSDKRIYFRHPHFADCTDGTLTCVNASGIPCTPSYPFSPHDYTLASLNHYQSRSVDVFCYKRLGTRSKVMFDHYPVNPTKEIERFFKYNDRTPEREQYIKDYCKTHNISCTYY